MHFENRFVVSGTPQAVAGHFADVPLMASFLPGASVDSPLPDGSYPATLVASFGPKKLAFKGTLTNAVDHEALTGVLKGQAAADVRGARMAVTMNYRLAEASGSRSEAPLTEVQLDSHAQLSGVLAEFAKAGGVIVAEALIAEFARRFSAHGQAEATGERYVVPEGGATLSLTTVMLAMLRRFMGWMRGSPS
jgi:carbon monoxide dehydrogenase subunit G